MAIEKNFTIDQGSNVEISFTVAYSNGSVWDLSDYTVNSKMRKHPQANTAYNFTGTANSIGGVVLTMSAVDSANVPFGRYFYDVEVVSSANTTTRVRQGIITVNPEMTR